MPIIFLLITETELRPSMRLLDVQQDCKGEVTGTLLVEPTDGDDVDITIIFDQWFTVRNTCHYIEFSPPGSISMFRYGVPRVFSRGGHGGRHQSFRLQRSCKEELAQWGR